MQFPYIFSVKVHIDSMYRLIRSSSRVEWPLDTLSVAGVAKAIAFSMATFCTHILSESE